MIYKIEEMDMHQYLVSAFMKAANQELPESPTIPDEKVRALRAKLILEEALETIYALGFIAHVHPGSGPKHEFKVIPHDDGCDIVEVLDGCCDVNVVITGTLSAFGIAGRMPQYLVDQNNLDKFGPGHSIREDGKLIKPPTHRPPDLKTELLRQGYEGVL